MIQARRYWVQSREHLRQVAAEVARLDVAPGRVAEIIIRPAKREKSSDQRGLFHVLLAEAGLHLGLTPREVKEWFKADYYGEDVRTVTIHGQTFSIKTVQSTEDEDRAGYGRLLDFLFQWAAEKGIVLLDHRQPANLQEQDQ